MAVILVDLSGISVPTTEAAILSEFISFARTSFTVALMFFFIKSIRRGGRTND